MTVSFRRPEGDRELDALADILTEAFSVPPDKIRERFAFIGYENLRVLCHDDVVAGGLWHIPMGQYFGGRSVPLVGIAGVGVSTDHRGLGVAHDMMARTMNEFREAGVPLSGLYPATQTLYRKSGYEQCGHRMEINLRLDAIRLRVSGPEVRRLTEGDRPQVEALYREVARTRDGYLDRGTYIWDRVYQPMGEATRGYGVFADGALEGYLYLLHRDKTGGIYNLSLTDFVFKTPRAGKRLLALLGDHSSMAREVRWYGGPADPATFLLSEQKHTAEFRFYWMDRITHLENALAARGYPPGLQAELHLEVRDDIVAAHNGRFTLRVADGTGSVRPGGRGELALDVRDLAALYTGFQDPHALARTGRVSGSEEALRRAQGVFAGPVPTMADMY